MWLWFMLVSVTYVSLRGEFDLFVICVELFSRLSILWKTKKSERAIIPHPFLLLWSCVGWSNEKFLLWSCILFMSPLVRNTFFA